MKLPGKSLKLKRVTRLEVPQQATKYLRVIRKYLHVYVHMFIMHTYVGHPLWCLLL